MLQGLNFVILNVSDMDQARHFYTEKLGLEVLGGGPAFVQFKPGQDSATFALQLEQGSRHYSGVELWWQVDNADATFNQIVSRGAKVASEPKDEPFGRAFAVEDPAGNRINMFQLPQQS